VCQLVSSQQLVDNPLCAVVDSQRGHVMYVGQDRGTVGVFEPWYRRVMHSLISGEI
jgi:hypothetical protein